MSRDKVIQDSDEDEPLIEDDFPASPDPLQPTQSPITEHHDHPEQETFRPLEHGAHQCFPEPQLNVNFDQFLQSQGTHVTSTSSQQQREERWIPATCEGGGASSGAITTEIGLAQDRLFNDNVSSAAQRLPSTATHYPSEISQPGSFPTMESYNYEQYNPGTNGNAAHMMNPHDVPYEATQLLMPGHAAPYDYNTPAVSNYISSPSDATTALTSAPPTESMLPNSSKVAAHRSKSMQSMQYSPHDTEPFSSVTSPRLNRAKSDTARSGLISPRHSPTSMHDELALPAVTVEVSSVTKKRRGRPSKTSLPGNDDDDELALDGDSNPSPSELSKNKLPERSAEQTPNEIMDEPAAAQDGMPENEVSDVPTSAEAAEKITSIGEDTNTPAATENKEKPTIKGPKKKKVKRSKTASAAMQKSHISDVDDDVIWVDSRSLQDQDQDAQGENKSKADAQQSDTAPLVPTVPNETSTSATKPEKPPPKKRGRKRKNVAEQPIESASEPAEKANSPLDDVDSNTVSDCVKLQESSDPNKGVANNAAAIDAQSSDKVQSEPPVVEAEKEPTPTEPVLQTPQGSDQTPNTPASKISAKAQTGGAKNSPIMSTSKVPYRVGLSKRARIAPLLKIVRK